MKSSDMTTDLKPGDPVWWRYQDAAPWLPGNIGRPWNEGEEAPGRVWIAGEVSWTLARNVRLRGPSPELLAECRRRIALASPDDRVINGETADATTLLSELLASLEPPK